MTKENNNENNHKKKFLIIIFVIFLLLIALVIGLYFGIKLAQKKYEGDSSISSTPISSEVVDADGETIYNNLVTYINDKIFPLEVDKIVAISYDNPSIYISTINKEYMTLVPVTILSISYNEGITSFLSLLLNSADIDTNYELINEMLLKDINISSYSSFINSYGSNSYLSNSISGPLPINNEEIHFSGTYINSDNKYVSLTNIAIDIVNDKLIEEPSNNFDYVKYIVKDTDTYLLKLLNYMYSN